MKKLIIVGISGITHLGSTFLTSAKALNLDCELLNVGSAYQAPKLIKTFNWYLGGKYPTKLKKFSREIVNQCRSYRPQWLLTTGLSAIDSSALKEIGKLGIKRLNFLTDDPWNKAHYAPWFFNALPHYDIIFSPRRANMPDLFKVGCQRVEYLHFGYDEALFYPETVEQEIQTIPDILFAGAADKDRVPYMHALIKSGIQLALYGSFWEKYPETKSHTLGQADVPTLRSAIARAKICLCLVRRANRDGHCMRTFEVSAVGGCMLTEDTQEHRDIFGNEGENVLYFNSVSEMLDKTQWLLEHEQERQRLANNAYKLITQGHHTYGDRLQTMLAFIR
jgi:spore maturation protein CgeB